jgi:hypothetical protein
MAFILSISVCVNQHAASYSMAPNSTAAPSQGMQTGSHRNTVRSALHVFLDTSEYNVVMKDKAHTPKKSNTERSYHGTLCRYSYHISLNACMLMCLYCYYMVLLLSTQVYYLIIVQLALAAS